MRTRTLLASGTAALALVLAGCSSPAAEPDSEQNPSTEEPTPQAEAGLIAEVDPSALTTTASDAPEDVDPLIVPSGEVQVDSIASAETIPSSIANTGSPSDGGGEEALAPAEGEVFRVVTVTTSETTGVEGEGAPLEASGHEEPGVRLGFEVGEQTQEQPDEAAGTRTFVVSAPEEEDLFLTATEAGKTQKVDLTSGERDSASAAVGYYWEPSEADTGDPLALPGVEATGTLGSEEKSATLTPVVAVESARFTGWTEDAGWAEDGHAWLLLDGTVDMETSGAGELRGAASVEVALAVDGVDAGTFRVELERSGGARETEAEFSERIAVPAGAEALTVAATGEVQVSAAGGVQLTSDATASAGEAETEIALAG